MKFSHNDLVAKARNWLWKQGCAVVITEMACTREEPDAIGFQAGGHSILVECKISRNDFLTDRQKRALRQFVGMGTHRYYLIPASIDIEPGEVPEKYGLLVCKDKRSLPKIITPAGVFYPTHRTIINEVALLVSAMRRMRGVPPVGTSVRCYFYKTKNRATLGIKEVSPNEVLSQVCETEVKTG